MSISASIGLRIVNLKNGNPLSATKILEKLVGFGWSLQHNEYVCYLPLGDNDDFAWTGGVMSIDQLMKILHQKEQLGELIGVLLTWQDTEIGGSLLLCDQNDAKSKNIHTPVSFSLDGNRKILADFGNFKITDVNWYLEKLLPIFNNGDTIVEFFTYDEHI